MILSEADLVAAVTRDRAAGKRIGFVGLSFDLLRVGEVRRIQAAAAEADRLVVAVVDDERPHVMTIADRAELDDQNPVHARTSGVTSAASPSTRLAGQTMT